MFQRCCPALGQMELGEDSFLRSVCVCGCVCGCVCVWVCRWVGACVHAHVHGLHVCVSTFYSSMATLLHSTVCTAL